MIISQGAQGPSLLILHPRGAVIVLSFETPVHRIARSAGSAHRPSFSPSASSRPFFVRLAKGCGSTKGSEEEDRGQPGNCPYFFMRIAVSSIIRASFDDKNREIHDVRMMKPHEDPDDPCPRVEQTLFASERSHGLRAELSSSPPGIGGRKREHVGHVDRRRRQIDRAFAGDNLASGRRCAKREGKRKTTASEEGSL